MEQRLCACSSSGKGTLKLSGFLLESGANKDQGMTDGATPLFVAAQEGHVEVVRFLVESGANNDQGMTDDGATPLFHSSSERAHGSCPISGRVWCEQRPRHDRWINAFGSKQLRKGARKLSDFWLSQVPTKTNARTEDGATLTPCIHSSAERAR